VAAAIPSTVEQTLIANAVLAWKQNIDRADKFFSRLTDEQVLQEIAPGKNRLIYLFGHLVAVHDAMRPLFGLGPRLHPELEAMFLTGADRSVAEIPSRADIKRMWDEVNASVLDGISAFTAADWTQKHSVVSDADFAANPLRNRLAILLSRTSHVGYHMGQCVLASV
jgi:hypothetical protein